MSDGGLSKPEKDFTKEADKLIPEAEALAKVRLASPGCDYNADMLFLQSDVQGAIDKLLGLEKQTRQVLICSYLHHPDLC